SKRITSWVQTKGMEGGRSFHVAGKVIVESRYTVHPLLHRRADLVDHLVQQQIAQNTHHCGRVPEGSQFSRYIERFASNASAPVAVRIGKKRDRNIQFLCLPGKQHGKVGIFSRLEHDERGIGVVRQKYFLKITTGCVDEENAVP